MQRYRPGEDVGPLAPWPFANPASDYRILAGRPRASGRIDAGGPGQPMRQGIWRCTEGTFSCIEQGDELMTILSGACRLTLHDSGETIELGPGDSLFIRDGSRATWEVRAAVTKVFLGVRPGGF